MTATNAAKQSAEEKEAFHRAAEARIKTFKNETPPDTGKPKDVVPLVRSGMLTVLVQTVRNGGENNLHYHVNSETAWMVLSGQARFYGVDDVLLADLGPSEGIFLPGGSRYWFEKVGSEDLQLLQMVGVDARAGKDTRINVEAHKDWMTDSILQIYEEQPEPAR